MTVKFHKEKKDGDKELRHLSMSLSLQICLKPHIGMTSVIAQPQQDSHILGRNMRISIITQKEQRYARNKIQKHKTVPRGNSVITEFTCVYFPHAYILHSKRGGGTQQTSLT